MIKVLSLVATCMAVISFSGFAAEAPSTAAANPYEQMINTRNLPPKSVVNQ